MPQIDPSHCMPVATSRWRLSMVCDVSTYKRPKWDVATTSHAEWVGIWCCWMFFMVSITELECYFTSVILIFLFLIFFVWCDNALCRVLLVGHFLLIGHWYFLEADAWSYVIFWKAELVSNFYWNIFAAWGIEPDHFFYVVWFLCFLWLQIFGMLIKFSNSVQYKANMRLF